MNLINNFIFSALPKNSQDKPTLQDPLSILKLDEPSDFSSNLPTKQFDTESVNSLQLTDVPPDYEQSEEKKSAPLEDDFDDFTSFQGNNEKEDYSINWPSDNMVPLRETYIVNDSKKEYKKEENEEINWTKPTERTSNTNKTTVNEFEILKPIVTNEISTKSSTIESTNWFSKVPVIDKMPVQSSENIVQNDTHEELDDEFTDFQMVLPNTNMNTNTKVSNGESTLQVTSNVVTTPVVLEPFKPQMVLEPLKPSIVPNASNNIIWPDPGGIDEMEFLSAFSYRKQDNSNKKEEDKKASNEIIVGKSETVEPVKIESVNSMFDNANASSIMESYTASKLQNSHNVATSNIQSTKNVTNNTSKYDSTNRNTKFAGVSSNINVKMPAPVSAKIGGKQLQRVENDDDDWSDFVSNQNVAPQNKLYVKESAKPELQLSIGQLSQIKPPKKSIPIITPHGLLQTKLPMSIPNVKPEVTNVLQSQIPSDGYQPAIISNQFNAQVSGYLDQGNKMVNNFYGYNRKPVLTPNNMQNLTGNVTGTNGTGNMSMWNPQPMFTVQGNSVSSSQSLNHKSSPVHKVDDDDDWSDFVSGKYFV